MTMSSDDSDLMVFPARDAAFTVRTRLKDGSVRVAERPFEAMPDGALRARIPASEIDPGAEWVEIVHPRFRARRGDSGYWLGPRGQLGHFTRQTGCSWTTDVYNNFLLLPVCGFKTDAGFVLAWIKGLRFETEIRVDVSDGLHEMPIRFRVAKIGFAPYEDAVVDFYDLGPDADYSRAGRFFRKTRLARGEIVPLLEKMRQRPEVAYLAEALVARLPHFAEKERRPGDQTPETEPPVEVKYTYAQALDLMRRLKAAGVERMEFCASGWSCGGYDGRYPAFFPSEEKLGGDEALRAFVREAETLGFRVGLQSAYTAAFKISPRWSEDIVCKNPDGSLTRGETYWCGGDCYRACVRRVADLYLDEDIASWKSLDLTGANYLDVFTAISPCPCSDPNHPLNRAQAAETQRAIARRCIDELGGFASECGEDHLINELSYINYVAPDIAHWQGYQRMMRIPDQEAAFPLEVLDKDRDPIDEIVPFWEIVYHGFVFHPTDRLTQSHTIAPSRKRSPSTWLLSVEFAGRPIAYIEPDTPVEEIKRLCDDWKPLARFDTLFLDEHRRLSNTARLIRYSDGTEIVVNYGREPLAHGGESVPPRSYRVFPPDGAD